MTTTVERPETLVDRPEHLHDRPSWDCQTCRQQWPCANAKADLKAEFSGFPSVLAIYILFWTMCLFQVLPFGVRTPEEEGLECPPGHAPSAPHKFRPGLVIVRTTIVSGASASMRSQTSRAPGGGASGSSRSAAPRDSTAKEATSGSQSLPSSQSGWGCRHSHRPSATSRISTVTVAETRA